MEIIISEKRDLKIEAILDLYRANKWSSAEKPTQLYNALINSHSLISAWDNSNLVGIGNAISDGYLIDFYKKAGFVRAGNTEPMWIYKGDEH